MLASYGWRWLVAPKDWEKTALSDLSLPMFKTLRPDVYDVPDREGLEYFGSLKKAC